MKANYVDRFQKTLKSRLYRSMTKRKSWKWIDLLDDLIWSYNHTVHSTIKMSPASVTQGEMEDIAWRHQYESHPTPPPDGAFKLKVGDLVRLSHVAKVFRREYQERWTLEIVRATSRRKRGGLNVYTVEDVKGEASQGSYYEKELQSVTLDLSGVFDVDHVIKTRKQRGKKQYLIRWKGYPPKFDSWVEEKDFVKKK